MTESRTAPFCGGKLRVIEDVTDPDLIRKFFTPSMVKTAGWLPPTRVRGIDHSGI